MTILITGAGGFIGLNVVERLLSAGRDVVALSLTPLPAASLVTFADLPGRLSVEIGDVCDAAFLRAVMRRHEIARIVHAAAITAGPRTDPARATQVIDVNVAGTNLVLALAREAGVQRCVLTSSTAVYGDAPFGAAPLDETVVPTPQTLYGFTKLAMERLGVLYREAFGLDVVRTRLTAIYGPWEYDTGVRDTLSPPLQIATSALRGIPVTVADGGRRDWTLGTDIARALVTLLEADSTNHDLYNLGCGEVWHPEMLCQALASHRPDWEWRRGAPGDEPSIAYNDALDRPRRSPPSSERFNSEFGAVFQAPAAGVAVYAAWVAANSAAVVAPNQDFTPGSI